MSSKSILITGANGFTGQHACRYFLQKGYFVFAVVREKTIDGKTEEKQGRYQEIVCDLTDEEAVDHLINSTQPDYILHTAGKNDVKGSWQYPSQYIKMNVLATVYLLEAVRKHKISTRILVIGSALEYNPVTEQPNHPYGLTKSLQSLVAKSWETLFHLPILIAKPTNLIGPGPSNGICSLVGKEISHVEKKLPVHLVKVHNTSSQRDFLDIRDAIRAYESLLLDGEIGEIYPIGSGNYLTIQDVLSTFQRLTAFSLPIEQDEGNEKAAQNEEKKEIDLTKIKSLGWQPTYSFQNSLFDILNYYRNKEGSK